MWSKKCDKSDNLASGNKLGTVANVAHHLRIAFADAISYLTLEREFLATLSSLLEQLLLSLLPGFAGIVFCLRDQVACVCIHATVCLNISILNIQCVTYADVFIISFSCLYSVLQSVADR